MYCYYLGSAEFYIQHTFIKCDGVELLQASVSVKRLGDFLQNKDIAEGNVLHYPQSEDDGNSKVDFL